MQAFQDRYVLMVDTSEMESARSDVSETVHEFVRRPGTGRRKTHVPWRSPWDASVCTVYANLPPTYSPLKPIPALSGGAAPGAPASAGECLTPCSVLPGAVGAAAAGGPRRGGGKGKQELCGPCCHCGATSSPQWRKGPKGKPILCNACGIRFLRTRSLGKVTPKKRRSPAAVGGGGGAAAKRLKLEDNDSDADDGRTSSGVEYALEDAQPPEAETEEPTDEIQEDVAALPVALQAAAAAKLGAACAAARPAGSGVAGGGVAAAGGGGDEATGGLLTAALKQQQQLLQRQLQQFAAAQQKAGVAGAAVPLAPQPLVMLQALGLPGSYPQGLKREGQGSAPSSPAVGALPAGAVPLAALDGSLQLLLAGGGGLVAAAPAEEPAAGLVVQRSRSKGPASSAKTL